MTGQELHTLLFSKWGKSYDVQIKKVKGKFFFQVMWKYLEQTSFPMSQTWYFNHLDTVANYLTAWGSTQQIVTYLEQTHDRPRMGRAISIALDLGEKTSEWILD